MQQSVFLDCYGAEAPEITDRSSKAANSLRSRRVCDLPFRKGQGNLNDCYRKTAYSERFSEKNMILLDGKRKKVRYDKNRAPSQKDKLLCAFVWKLPVLAVYFVLNLDDEIVKEQVVYQELLCEYNQTEPSESEKRALLLKQMLGGLRGRGIPAG